MVIKIMCLMKWLRVKTLLIFIIAFTSSVPEVLMAQEDNFKDIITPFKNYSASFREVAYCHLNKSIYIKGEMIGFSGYIFDKDLKIPSKLTKNLYCIITDENNKVIKSKLVKVNDGFTNNVFNLDSLFTSGNYKFKAYTNWMKNFDERNVFVESFKVINPEVESTIKRTQKENILDAQFLPEGGHFVDLVKTNVGVIIKNIKGFGLSDTEGNVYDSNNKFITSFKTNSSGIGRFLLYPEINQKYTVKINHLNKAFQFIIDDIKSKGISIHVNSSNGKLALELKTNERTLKDIKNKPFKLVIHNGKDIKGLGLTFKEKDLVKMVDFEELFPGINIFTLFDENNMAILERMFFNYNGINLMRSGNANYTKLKDSVRISVPLMKGVNSLKKSLNISISVLPEETKSYHRHHNIISHTYLQPYVKGYIENAKYYFTNIDAEKKYDLDNLLVTQGWSSYNWNNIFNNNVIDSFVFEDGILLKANKNSNAKNDFILYPLKKNDGHIINLSENKNSFVKSGLFPEEGEKLSIGALSKKGKINSPGLYVQFFPSKIPEFNNEFEAMYPKQSAITKATPNKPFTLIDIKKTQQLEGVIVNANRRKSTKLEKFQSSAFDVVDVFNNSKREMNLTFANYVNAYLPDFIASEAGGTLDVISRVQTSLIGTGRPAIYLDDVLISSLEIFIGFFMNDVDFVAVNRRGLGEGFLGANGVIRIYTSNGFYNRDIKTNFSRKFEFPLAFAENKKYYVPKYDLYNDDFFKEYGVIDWIPNCKVDSKGNLNFTVYNPANNNIKLFIEGVNDEGEFLSENKVIDMHNSNP